MSKSLRLLITTSYESLIGIVDSEKEDVLKEENVKLWCLLFHEIVSISN